jgi:16S rRNA (adenine1518-N6/adenine1519-N6)-dimethyltransferase
VSMARWREHRVRPDRELGQNFLVDPNILGVIGREARLAAGDVVLEIGGGLGVLSEHLAERVAHVHVVEVDRRLAAPLEEAVGERANVTLHWGDALELDLAALRPPPGKLVANLPYGIAATAILRSIGELPGMRLWLAMVQREVGERLAAPPSSSAYGAPSVLAQLACDVRVVRRIPRTVFTPVPHVDSVLVRLERRAGAASPEVSRLVHAAFAHRRKALAGSLALAPGAQPGVRDAARAALAELGLPPDARAERLAPADFRRLAERL